MFVVFVFAYLFYQSFLNFLYMNCAPIWSTINVSFYQINCCVTPSCSETTLVHTLLFLSPFCICMVLQYVVYFVVRFFSVFMKTSLDWLRAIITSTRVKVVNCLYSVYTCSWQIEIWVPNSCSYCQTGVIWLYSYNSFTFKYLVTGILKKNNCEN